MKKIVYQGIEGSFSHITARRLFGSFCVIEGKPTFRDVYEAVEKAAADLALMPIENTLAGTIYETIDLLGQGSLHIVGTAQTRIQHSLLGMAKSSIKQIRKVLSHPKALEQCSQFLSKHPWIEAVPHYDTAGAARDVAKMRDPTLAAIAHKDVGPMVGLDVFAQEIEDHAENYTRFLILSKSPSKGRRCSILFTTEHRMGSISEILTWLAKRGANLTTIVSRPWVGKHFEYQFYVELEASQEFSLEELKEKTQSLRVLGWFDELS